MRKGRHLENLIQTSDKDCMLDWELVPVHCGKCINHVVGGYVVSSSFASLIGETLIDLTDGVAKVYAGPNRFQKNIVKQTKYIAQSEMQLWRTVTLIALARKKFEQ